MQILAIVVRYKTSLEDSATMRTLNAEFELNPDLRSAVGALVWDNSPRPASFDGIRRWFEYKHSKENQGVSGAYNGALERAEALECPWLLLLDQDTVLPPGYLQCMLHYSRMLCKESRIATIVPYVRSNGNLVSPRRAGRTLRSSQIAETESGVIKEDCFAVNSGTLIRASALRAIGGYSDLFWLDLSDQYVFYLLHKAGHAMYLAADLELQHFIANSDYDHAMSPERYQSYLAAENIFLRMFRSHFMNGAHNLLLLARTARQYHRFDNKAFAKLTLRSLWQRLLLSRDRGIELWTQELKQRNIPLVKEGERIA